MTLSDRVQLEERKEQKNSRKLLLYIQLTCIISTEKYSSLLFFWYLNSLSFICFNFHRITQIDSRFLNFQSIAMNFWKGFAVFTYCAKNLYTHE